MVRADACRIPPLQPAQGGGHGMECTALPPTQELAARSADAGPRTSSFRGWLGLHSSTISLWHVAGYWLLDPLLPSAPPAAGTAAAASLPPAAASAASSSGLRPDAERQATSCWLALRYRRASASACRVTGAKEEGGGWWRSTGCLAGQTAPVNCVAI